MVETSLPRASDSRSPAAALLPRSPVFIRDQEGVAIVLVPLADGLNSASLLQEDWDRLVTADAHTGWCLNSNGKGHSYVRCGRARFSGCVETVARLIASAGPRQTVRYVDNNRLNLRRENLRVDPKPGGKRLRSVPAETTGY